MAKKRTPQTFEKRARERNKQLKREAKQAERLARNAAKREFKSEQGGAPTEVPVIDPREMFLLPEEQPDRKEEDDES